MLTRPAVSAQSECVRSDEGADGVGVRRVKTACADVAVEPFQLVTTMQRTGSRDLERKVSDLACDAGAVLLRCEQAEEGTVTEILSGGE